MTTSTTARRQPRRPAAAQQAMTSDEANANVSAALAALAGARRVNEAVASGIRDHEETFYLKPIEQTYAEGAKLFAKAAEDEGMVEPYMHTFKHRPWDVALAFVRVVKAQYGVAPSPLRPGINPMTGEPVYKSARVEIPVDPEGHTVSMPYGTVGMDMLGKGAQVEYGMDRDQHLGIVGQLNFTVKRQMHDTCRGLCLLVEEDLKTNSIYKGKAITAEYEPTFLNPWKATNREEIIWTSDVDAALRGSILNVIRFTERAYDRGQKIHRSVLLKGDPGNGKSETLNIIAMECVANGWTYVLGTGTLQDALNQARMYAPAVIALEDFERLVAEVDAQEVSVLLEELDGTSSKGHDIMLVTTTNFVDDLNQRIRRRMAKEITFGPFDAEACARFLEVKLRDISIGEIDYPRIASTMDGWGNSYISKVVEFASGIALEHEEPQLTTQDLLDASEAQRPDWEAYQNSQLREPPKPFDMALKSLMKDSLTDDDVIITHPQLGQLHFEKAPAN